MSRIELYDNLVMVYKVEIDLEKEMSQSPRLVDVPNNIKSLPLKKNNQSELFYSIIYD